MVLGHEDSRETSRTGGERQILVHESLTVSAVEAAGKVDGTK